MKLILFATLISLSAFAGTEIKLAQKTIRTQNLLQIFDQNAESQTEWLIQFKKPITEKNKSVLKQYGVSIYNYLPEDTLLVRTKFSVIKQVKQLIEVQAVLPFQADMKISRTLGVLSEPTSQVRETYIVSVFDQSERTLIESQIKQLDQSILIQRSAGRNFVITTERKQLLSIAALEGVENIQSFLQVEPFHTLLDEETPAEEPPVNTPKGDYTDLNGFETGTKVMNFESAWSMGLTGQNQIVAMADTGLDSGKADMIHADFAGAIKSGYAVGMFGRSWEDPMGHGTHVAGSVLGRGTSSGGLLKGGAYSSQMVVQGMWSPILNNLSVPSNLGAMFTQAYADGARIHTNSWGSAASFGTYDKMAATVDEVMFQKDDLLILFAAGNSGTDKNKDGRIDPNSVATPGTSKNALTVGASENLNSVGGIQKKVGELKPAPENWPVAPISEDKLSDNINGIAVFSSRGPTSDNRIKPDIVAPGTNILSTRSHHPKAESLWGVYNAEYVYAGGTSMATPLTAGAAAITRQYLIEKLAQANPSAALVKAYLLHTATEMFPGQFGEGGAAKAQEILTLRPNNDEGYGRVNMAQVVTLKDTAVLAVVDSKGVSTGQSEEFTITAPKEGKLVVNLVWTDAPGSVNAGKFLVNDLDLSVTIPNASTVQVSDKINNHEFVEYETGPGEIKIKVTGSNVPMGKEGKQPYALVVSVQ